MRLAAVVLGRVLASIETVDLNPHGSAFFPEIIQKVVGRFEFQKFPQTFEETDEDKGVNFFEGRWNGVTVDKLTIFRGAIIVDTSASTGDSERIMDEALTWAASDLGLTYQRGMIKGKQYVSDLTFYSDIELLAAHRALLNLREGIDNAAEKCFGQPLRYDITRLDLDFDKTQKPLVTAPFSIQRRGNAPFSEHKYFSEAALPTDVHVRLLEQFEVDLSGRG